MSTRDNLRDRLRRSIRKGIAIRVMEFTRFSTVDSHPLLKGLSDQACSHNLVNEIVDAILDDWKVTERPRGERRV